MARSRKISRLHKKLGQIEKRLKEGTNLSAKNLYGFSDYTPYNAITGKRIMSRPILSDPQQKVHGSFHG
jgi:hypothetical protein